MSEINQVRSNDEGNTFSQNQYNLSNEAAAQLRAKNIPANIAGEKAVAGANEEIEETFSVWDAIQAFADNMDVNQQLAIEQGEYLKNLNQESIAYTIHMGQIPKVTPEDLKQDPTDEDVANAFNDFNNNDLALVYQDLQRQQDVVDQASKQQQNFMNQTTEIINDDANTLKSLLDVMGQLFKAFSGA